MLNNKTKELVAIAIVEELWLNGRIQEETKEKVVDDTKKDYSQSTRY